MKKVEQFLAKHWRLIVLITLGALLIYATRYFITSFQSAYYQGDFRSEYHHHDQGVTSPTSSTSTSQPDERTIRTIQPWMTFNYLNVVFKMPNDYFKNLLGINDPRYPNIRIDSYAAESHIDQQLLLQTIRHYISVYKAQ